MNSYTLEDFASINELLAILILSIIFVTIIGTVEFVKRKFNIHAEYTRKFIHFSLVMVFIIFPYHFTNHWYASVCMVFFIIALLYLRKKNITLSIHQINRISYGDIFLPVAVYLNFLLLNYYNNKTIFYLPLLILSISDPAAFFVGKLFNKSEKSLQGSISFFLTAAVSSWILLTICNFQPLSHKILLTLTCSVLGSIVEAISYKGWDNITIPITISGILIIYVELFTRYGIS